MVRMKGMETATLISLITGGGTVLASVAALLTVRQVRLQRTLSNLPRLFPIEKPMYLYRTPAGVPAIVADRHLKSVEQFDYMRRWEFEVVNAGNGAAHHIEIRWHYGFVGKAGQIEFLGSSTGLAVLKDRSQIHYQFEYAKTGFGFPIMSPDQHVENRGVLPAGDRMVVRLPESIQYLISFGAWMQFVTNDMKPRTLFDAPFSLELIYRDIEGNTHRQVFFVDLHTFCVESKAQQLLFGVAEPLFEPHTTRQHTETVKRLYS